MFTPKISIGSIPLDASSMLITDITGNSPTDTTGYLQAAYLPQTSAEWYKQVYAQYLGEAPDKLVFSPTSDNQAPSATLSYQLTDGVYLITQYFTKQLDTLGYTVSPDGLTLTKNNADQWLDPLGIFEGVYGVIVSVDEDFDVADMSVISSLTNTTIVLQSELINGTDDGPLWIVYKVQKYILVMNTGEGSLMSDIGDMALDTLTCGGCDSSKTLSLFDRILLKSSAQINFNCGNYAKAHNAAILFSESSTPTSNCSGCV
jgi:hypothetical protein